MENPAATPEGFASSPTTGPFGELLGPLYVRPDGPPYVTGFVVQERHCNRAMTLHGAMLGALFDTAFYNAARRQYEMHIGLVTGHLAIDFVGVAEPGDWVEARIEVVKTGRSVVFLSGAAWNGERRVGSAMASFLTVDRGKRPLKA